MTRRAFAACLTLAMAAATPAPAWGGPWRRKKRRVRRRRIRRHVIWRTHNGRRHLVVPLGIAIGWELMVDDRVVVVHEIKPDVIIVKDSSGKTEEIAVLKEDTEENKVDHEGTEYEVEEAE